MVLDGLAFPEGPRWRDGRLWFSDMHDHRVVALDPVETMFQHSGPVSGLGWDPEGRLLVVSMHDRVLLRDGEPYADLSAFEPEQSNDMVVDAVGRAYVGGFGFAMGTDAPRGTHLVLVDTDGSVRSAADDLLFPNGAVITDDGGTLVVGETFGQRMTAFDVAPDGSLSNRREWAALDGSPDGCCLDAEGCIWVADPLHRRVLRVREGGEVLETVSTGDRMAIACMLGGTTLYVLTAEGLDADESRTRRWGRIEVVDVGVAGAGLP